MIDAIRDALFASKIVSYAQGFVLIRKVRHYALNNTQHDE